jgi:hypothetical protein
MRIMAPLDSKYLMYHYFPERKLFISKKKPGTVDNHLSGKPFFKTLQNCLPNHSSLFKYGGVR